MIKLVQCDTSPGGASAHTPCRVTRSMTAIAAVIATLTLLSAAPVMVGTRVDARVRPSSSNDRAVHRTSARWAARIVSKPLAGGAGNCDPGLAHHPVVPVRPGAAGPGGNGQVGQKDVAATPGIEAIMPMRQGRHDRAGCVGNVLPIVVAYGVLTAIFPSACPAVCSS